MRSIVLAESTRVKDLKRDFHKNRGNSLSWRQSPKFPILHRYILDPNDFVSWLKRYMKTSGLHDENGRILYIYSKTNLYSAYILFLVDAILSPKRKSSEDRTITLWRFESFKIVLSSCYY